MQSDKVRNYTYYERLGFSDFKSWSEEDLSRFIIYDFLNKFRELSSDKDNNNKLFSDGLRHKIKKYQNYRIPLGILDRFFLARYLKDSKKNKKKILFEGSKYPALIFEAQKSCQVRLMAQGKPDRLFALKHSIGCLGMNDLEPLALYYAEDKDIRHLYELVERMEEKISMVAPDYIVLQMDMFPLERAIVLAAKRLGIPTLVVQHGMFSSKTMSLDFMVADYVLLWGKYFKDLCIEKCMRTPEDTYILGYSYGIKNNPGPDHKKPVVCYLGQDMERERRDERLLQIRMETIRELSEICKELGLDFMYRPHYRRESKKIISDNLSGIYVTPKKESLEQTFKNADVLIALSSTALVEGAMRSKISLQLMNFPIETDNMEMLGVCSKSFETIGELKLYLAKISKADNLDEFKPKFNNDCIETRYDPGKRFLEIIQEIENKR